ncbi:MULTISPECIES: hypothetical protein [unclassified Bradyrhizobium]|uniref:hypothetical protein n=1 Tax=unclassified Bradyrhizobium TaxID=2631580 RepID=UPI001CD750DD|nr:MULTISPECIES: hypothetical protein [unclassified Bradyrhizobium]MCA1386023.1 hypothetical protein [Bradyrhizobium sp. BRP05]MCA1393821.1 hypothetical protein [Bradyrhizobium sp. IC3123]MCA1423465.1 hypothetical protein [Bradyrhizobium sp. BRP23]MCA1430641.1 hypothetical protein [Bradyrhizobium sp. NBAIM16]MCA1471217.1 hypothetical protein [Bradyrhizobium sp. IC3195]
MPDEKDAATFKQMVDAAVIRLAGLPDDRIIVQLERIVSAFEQVVRDGSPEVSTLALEKLRNYFLAEISQQLKQLSGGGAPGRA